MAAQNHDPFLDAGIRGYIVNTAKREHWRVKEIYTGGEEGLQDLIQDGFLCYYKCHARYVQTRSDLTGTPDERRWFQSLVKTTFSNHIKTLAAKHKGISERPASEFYVEGANEGDIFERNLPPQQELSSLFAALAQAPWELLELMRLLAGDGAAALGFKRKKVGRRSVAETTNEYYARLLGVDPQERDLVAELKEYFGGL